MTKQVVDEIKKIREKQRYMVGIIGWVGFKHTNVPVEHGQRFAGKSKYNFKKQLILAFDAIFSFSDYLLRLITYFGFFLVLTAIAFGSYIFIKALIYGNSVIGWSSLITSVIFIGGIQIFLLGILGQYIGRIYIEVKDRPLYILRKFLDKKENL